eukprot:3303352-Amphidinium_carterae.1
MSEVDIGDFKGILLDQCQASFSANMQRPPELAEEMWFGVRIPDAIVHGPQTFVRFEQQS